MKETKTQILFILCLIGLVFIILRLDKCKPTEKDEYWQDKAFKTDTVTVKEPYPVKGDSFPYKVPPKLVIRYLPSPNSNEIRCDKDSLIRVIDSLGKQITNINKTFLTQFPTSSKLVGGLFTKDSLKLDLLRTTGNIESEVYLVNYNKFKYQYLNNSIRAIANENPNRPNIPSSSFTQAFYGNIGYSVFDKVPFISSDYYLRYSKFQLDAEPKLTIEKNPQLQLNGKLGYMIR